MRLMPTLAVACATSGIPDRTDREGLVDALSALPGAPATAATRCRALRNTREECVLAVVEAAPGDPAAPGWCAALAPGVARDECHFQVAEGRGDLSACTAAGRFVDDCRLHLWSREVARAWRPDVDLADNAAALRARFGELGLDPGDPRFWSAAFRHGLGQGTLDLGRCDGLEPSLREACRHTGVALLHDRLNRARDTGRIACPEGTPPPDLAFAPDPDLDAAIEARRADLCRPGPRVPPPGATLRR